MSPHHPPDPSRFSGQNWVERLQFIRKYIDYLGGDASVKWKEKLDIAYEETMEGLQKAGRIQVSKHWLAYEADRLAWEKFVSDQPSMVIEWPWKHQTDTPDDIKEGVSATYQKWRLDRGLPICDTPEAFGSKEAIVLSLSQRHTAWDQLFHRRDFKAPITGPFQIAIPAWVDLETLVFAGGDYLLNTINNEIVPPHLAVSWHNEDKPYITLVVGFSPTSCVDPWSEQARYSLKYLWHSIVDWVTGAYHGETMTLETYLRIRKAVPSADPQYIDPVESAVESFNSIQEDVLGFKEQARKNREFLDHCRSDVLEIIQKPFSEAKAELTSWILRDENAMKERTETAHEIWVSSTTNERTIQEVCAWAWGIVVEAV
ncbi:hypothetical protein FPANT_13202 [Fusarium pseudoanthophilum]|uniref:Uncharacterized protein n=1 Tax=Fusarium pseudoanthophilum TaxID=48495 RepID=A0A8H5KDK5_9HYPO|nr:hypothetical protein FPANT_13202 [Fusarium pseudoanthophilum]